MNDEELLYFQQLNSLSDIPASLQHFHNEYEQAKAKLSVVATDTAQDHRSHKIKLQKDLREGRKFVRLGDSLVRSIEQVHNPPSEELLGKLSAIDQFIKISKYLEWVKFLNEARKFFEKRQTGEQWRKCLPVYDELNCYCSMMEDTKCANLKRVMFAECRKRYDILTSCALKNFGPVNWKTLAADDVKSATDNLRFLFKISEPLKHGECNLSLGMQYLLNSLKTQFKFHFMRKVKTNDIKKPEWYFTKILCWIKEYKDKFTESFGEIFEVEFPGRNMLAVFVEELSRLAVMKLEVDVPGLGNSLFTHYIDEVILFHKELGEIVPLAQINTPVLDVFTVDKTLKRWLQFETLSSFEFLKSIQQDKNKFAPHESGTAYPIPTMAVRVLTLVKTVGERVTVIPSLALNNCFYSLQCDILKDFLIYLTELMRSLDHKDDHFHLILNSAMYMLSVLEEWSYDLHYIKVTKFEGEKSPFSEVTTAYTLFQQDAQHSLETSISSAVTSKYSAYFKQSWILPHKLDTISPNCSEGLMELQQSLTSLHKTLPDDVFLQIWSNLAQSLQELYLKRILFKCQFNHAGTLQLKLDIQAFCGIFHDYCSPLYFAKLKENVTVLCQPTETVRLWRGEGLKNPEGLQELLVNKGIKMKLKDVMKILKQRADV